MEHRIFYLFSFFLFPRWPTIGECCWRETDKHLFLWLTNCDDDTRVFINKIFEIKRTTRGRRDFLQFKRFLGNPVSFCLINCLTSYCACWIFSHSLDFSLNTQHSKIATFSAHALSSLSHYQYFSIFFQTLSVYRQCFHEKFSRMCEKKLFFRSWALR